MDNRLPRILLVDDDPNLLVVIGDILKAKGFEHVTVLTGGEALTQMEEQPIDVALIDLRLEDMSGLEVLRGIKARSPETECILLTGHASQNSAIEAIQMGAYGFFQKPVEMDQVLLSIQRALEKRQSAQDLRESEERFRTLIEQSTEGVVLIGEDGIVIEWNSAETRITGIPQARALGTPFWEIQYQILLPERRAKSTPEYFKKVFFESFQTGQAGQLGRPLDVEIVAVTGEHKFIQQTAFLIKTEKGNRVGATFRDVTERRESEEKIRSALEEKESLLREVHHRVKNNLQAMIALMRMQSQQIQDEATRQFLRELEGQARTMALVYEQLYQSENLARVEMAPYLEQLTSNILEAFGKNRDLELKLNISAILDVAEAMPCGLIVNELFTNSLKYAFPPGFKDRPTVTIDLHQEGKTCHLTVSDNGVGLPPDLDLRSTRTLGLHLVHLWATHQLGGTLEVTEKPGAAISISFATQTKRES
jgi:PAS domain S-box-containing protein